MNDLPNRKPADETGETKPNIKIKRRIRLLTGLLALLTVLALIPFAASAATDPFVKVVFYAEKNPDAGLDGLVSLTVKKKTTGVYTGTLFLPGKADAGAVTLSWDASLGMTVSDGAGDYENGALPVALPGENVSYTVALGGKRATFTLTTMRGSEGIEGLFFDLDESLGTIQAMNADKTHETSCYGAAAFAGKDDYIVSIKGRGNYTWKSGKKKPYNVTFFQNSDYVKKKKVELIDGVKTKKWSLLASYSDGSLLRSKVGQDLACRLGVGVESRFVDVWMNGEYLGNYLLTPKTDSFAPDGGYQLELDNKVDDTVPQFDLEGMRPDTGSANRFTVKSLGEDAEKAGVKTEDIQAWMQKLLNAVLGKAPGQDAEPEDYLDYIDLDSWAKVYLLQEFYKNFDIVSGSIFMHRDGLTDADKLFAGPVWDLDNSLGRTQKCDYSGISSDMQFSGGGWYIDSIDGKTAFLQFLGRNESFMERVYELYNEYKADFDGVLDHFRAQKELLADSAAMNFTKWDINQTVYNVTNVMWNKTYGSGDYKVSYVKTSDWQTYLTNLETYLTVRSGFLSDSLTVTPPAEGAIVGAADVSVGETLILTADTAADGYRWQVSSDGRTWVDIDSVSGKTFSVPVTASMNGLSVRCKAKNTGAVIETSRVAQAPAGAVTVLGPVTLTVSGGEPLPTGAETIR